MRKLKEIYPESFPTMKALKAQKALLVKEHGETTTRLKASEKAWRALRIAFCNVEAMMDLSDLARTRRLELVEQ